MRRPVRGFLGCLTCPVDNCGDLATLDNHAVEFADVDRIVKTQSQLVARAVANIADPDHGARKRAAKIKPSDMLAQLHKRCGCIAQFCVQRVPVTVPKLFCQQLKRLRMVYRVARAGQRLP